MSKYSTENLLINNDLLKKAEAIIEQRNKEQAIKDKEDRDKTEYIEKCIEAHICPSCGSELVIRDDGDEGGWSRDYSCKKCNFNKSYDGDYE